MTRILGTLALCAVLFCLQATTGAFASVTGCDLTPAGDMSYDFYNPTDLGSFCLGTNTVSGTIDVGEPENIGPNFIDVWEAALPVGYQIDSIGIQIANLFATNDWGYYETDPCYFGWTPGELKDCGRATTDGFYLLERDDYPMTPPQITFFATNDVDMDPNSAYYNYEWRIEVSQIPIPAAAWLFGSAPGLLGWLKCRST